MVTSDTSVISSQKEPEATLLAPVVFSLLTSATNVTFNFRTNKSKDSKLILQKIESVVPIEIKEFYNSQIKLSNDERVNLCRSTLNQASNQLWHRERKKRITASRAHKIFRAKSKTTILKYFFEDACNHQNLIYGREMEPKAKEKAASVLDAEVNDLGLISKQGQPWLSASPDGLIVYKNGEQALLEIKCPSSCFRSLISVPYLENSNSNLKKNHPYYTQIQIQLYCCELNKAVLFIYSECDYRIVEVLKDTEFL